MLHDAVENQKNKNLFELFINIFSGKKGVFFIFIFQLSIMFENQTLSNKLMQFALFIN